MRCPHCGQALIRGPLREYETLCEHVEDPNREEYPLRPTFVCPAGDACMAGYWDRDGDFYAARGFTGWGQRTEARDSLAERVRAEVAAEEAKP